MPTSGQAGFIRANVNSYISFAFICVYCLGVGLILWYAAFGHNPIADMLVQEAHATQQAN